VIRDHYADKKANEIKRRLFYFISLQIIDKLKESSFEKLLSIS